MPHTSPDPSSPGSATKPSKPTRPDEASQLDDYYLTDARYTLFPPPAQEGVLCMKVDDLLLELPDEVPPLIPLVETTEKEALKAPDSALFGKPASAPSFPPASPASATANNLTGIASPANTPNLPGSESYLQRRRKRVSGDPWRSPEYPVTHVPSQAAKASDTPAFGPLLGPVLGPTNAQSAPSPQEAPSAIPGLSTSNSYGKRREKRALASAGRKPIDLKALFAPAVPILPPLPPVEGETTKSPAFSSSPAQKNSPSLALQPEKNTRTVKGNFSGRSDDFLIITSSPSPDKRPTAFFDETNLLPLSPLLPPLLEDSALATIPPGKENAYPVTHAQPVIHGQGGTAFAPSRQSLSGGQAYEGQAYEGQAYGEQLSGAQAPKMQAAKAQAVSAQAARAPAPRPENTAETQQNLPSTPRTKQKQLQPDPLIDGALPPLPPRTVPLAASVPPSSPKAPQYSAPRRAHTAQTQRGTLSAAARAFHAHSRSPSTRERISLVDDIEPESRLAGISLVDDTAPAERPRFSLVDPDPLTDEQKISGVSGIAWEEGAERSTRGGWGQKIRSSVNKMFGGKTLFGRKNLLAFSLGGKKRKKNASTATNTAPATAAIQSPAQSSGQTPQSHSTPSDATPKSQVTKTSSSASVAPPPQPAEAPWDTWDDDDDNTPVWTPPTQGLSSETSSKAPANPTPPLPDQDDEVFSLTDLLSPPAPESQAINSIKDDTANKQEGPRSGEGQGSASDPSKAGILGWISKLFTGD